MRILSRYSIILCGLLLTNCLGIRHLKDGESLLHKQEISGASDVDKEDLQALYQQKPNNRFPIPFVWLYQQGEKAYDTAKVNKKIADIKKKFDKKISENLDNSRRFSNLNAKKAAKIEAQKKVLEEGNLLMRWGEPLAVFDSAKVVEATKQFNRYLNAKGYFHAKTEYEIKTKGKKKTVKYTLLPGNVFKISQTSFITKDTTVAKLMANNLSESLLQPGKDYDQSKFSAERTRIDGFLKDNGYFDFSKQYIVFEVDSLKGNHELDITTIINTPPGKDQHKVFYIDTVKFRTDANIVASGSKRSTENYNGVSYEFFRKRFSRRVLDSRLFIYPDLKYNRTNTFNTQRQLANLDMFRFVNINYDTVGGKMVANIFASPLKKYQPSVEVGIGINVTEGFPGPFANVVFKNRNLFGGLEILEFNGRFGIEGLPVTGEDREIYSSQEVSGNFSLTFPQFIVPFSNKLRSGFGSLNPKTRITIGDTYINRPDYRRNNLNGSLAYSWLKRNKQFVLTLDEVGLINSSISNTFRDELILRAQQGSNLFRSFEPSFVSSMSLLTNINFNSYGVGDNKAAFLKIFVESGGTSLNLLSQDRLNDIFYSGDSLEYYQYVKVNLDFRRNLPLSPTNTLAYRINLGIAKPYSTNNILPYEKYFFAGGSNGIRAWRPRRLGPGSYTPFNTDGIYDDRFEQFGEIILESSIEIRRNLFGFLDGALFIDAGNIWTFEEEEGRPGSKFEFDSFLREIAVGAGFGLRFDFSFLVLRFDGAFKIVDPARPVGQRFILRNNLSESGKAAFENQDLFIINIGIGYPF